MTYRSYARLAGGVGLVVLGAVGCQGPRDDGAAAGEDADLVSATSFEACKTSTSGNVLYSPDKRKIAYVTCPSKDGPNVSVRIVDVATGATRDAGELDDLEVLEPSSDGLHFGAIDVRRRLHLFSWDGEAARIFDDVGGYVMSEDGTRIATYRQMHEDARTYVLDVRVVDLDGALDSRAHFEEERPDGVVRGDAEVIATAFSPDGAKVAFVRKHATQTETETFLTELDVAEGAFRSGRSFGAAERVFADTYDGATMAAIVADPDGRRRFVFEPARGEPFDAVLPKLDSGSPAGAFCATATEGALTFWASDEADGSVSLVRWSQKDGARNLARLAPGDPRTPSRCPEIGGDGAYAYWATSGAGWAALSLTTAAKPVPIEDATSPAPQLIAGAKRLALVLLRGGELVAELVDPASGETTEVPIRADGASLGRTLTFGNGDTLVALGRNVRASSPDHSVSTLSLWASRNGASFTEELTLSGETPAELTAKLRPLGSRVAIERETEPGLRVNVTVAAIR